MAYLHKTPKIIQWLYPQLQWRYRSNNKILYLTFDDGPIPEVTPKVLDFLKQRNIKASFFCVGENIEKHPNIFRRVVDEGHTIANHTYNHLNGWKTSDEDYLENIKRCNTQISKFGLNNKLFRPPYGRITRRQIKLLKDEYKIVMWDVLSGDFDHELSNERCLRRTIDSTSCGSIIIFHDSIKSISKIDHVLPAYIDHFLNKGFKFLPL